KREDFSLYEDDKPVAITNFYAVPEAAQASPAGSASSEGSATPVAAENAAAAAAPPVEQRLYLALFLDERSLTAPARNRLLPALERFVASRLHPGDRVLLAAYNGSTRILQTPTENPEAIHTALRQLAKENPRGTENEMDRRRVLSDLNQAATQDEPNRPAMALEQANETYQAIRLLAQAGYDRVRATLGAVGQFVDALGGLPGRKAVVLVSGGLDERPGEALFQIWLNKFARFTQQVGASNFEAFRNDTTKLFDNLVEHANTSRVTFYTLAAPTDLSGRTADVAGDPNWTQDLAATESRNLLLPLQALAAGTGGLAAADTPVSFLESLRGDLDSYYSLGYTPAFRKDGKKHRLSVRLADRNLRARTRESYRERTGLEVTANHTFSALLLGEEVNPFGVSLAVEGESKDKKGQYQVTVLVKLPMEKLVLLPRGGAHEGRVRLFVGARDGEGRTSQVNEIALPIRVANSELQTVLGQSVGTRVTLLLRPGEHTLAVGVRDELGNTDSTVTSQYVAGSLTAAAAAASHPASSR
ncbi:MAG TPA: VWA domain-containing protein, partial [Thermoanaerobaculia bacterium]|nr:VWA domain-containing protein [Thermoanaerobaculia bacterium]